MSRSLIKAVETYRVDSEEEVVTFHDELRSDNEYELTKFQWTHKVTKNDDFYSVVATKVFNDMEEVDE